MQNINDPKVRAEIEAKEKALSNVMLSLREHKEFKVYLEELGKFSEYTKERIMTVKDHEDIKILQTYYQVLNNFIDLANYEDPNKRYTAATE